MDGWIAIHVVARTSLQQAGFFFALQTLSRRVSHRVAMAAALAVGLSLAFCRPGRRHDGSSVEACSPRNSSFSPASSAGFGTPHKFRRSFEPAGRPASLRGRGVAVHLWGQACRLVALVVPTLFALAIVGIPPPRRSVSRPCIRRRPASFRASDGGAVPPDLRVPFVSGYVPSVDVKLIGVEILASVLAGSFALAWVERRAFDTMMGYVALATTILLGLSGGVMVLDQCVPLSCWSRSIWMSIQCCRRSASTWQSEMAGMTFANLPGIMPQQAVQPDDRDFDNPLEDLEATAIGTSKHFLDAPLGIMNLWPWQSSSSDEWTATQRCPDIPKLMSRGTWLMRYKACFHVCATRPGCAPSNWSYNWNMTRTCAMNTTSHDSACSAAAGWTTAICRRSIRATSPIAWRAFRQIYRRHIAIEDRELFPLAAYLLPSRQLQEIGREMAARRFVAP